MGERGEQDVWGKVYHRVTGKQSSVNGAVRHAPPLFLAIRRQP